MHQRKRASSHSTGLIAFDRLALFEVHENTRLDRLFIAHERSASVPACMHIVYVLDRQPAVCASDPKHETQRDGARDICLANRVILCVLAIYSYIGGSRVHYACMGRREAAFD